MISKKKTPDHLIKKSIIERWNCFLPANSLGSFPSCTDCFFLKPAVDAARRAVQQRENFQIERGETDEQKDAKKGLKAAADAAFSNMKSDCFQSLFGEGSA